MSLYNMLAGMNQAAFFVAPLVVGHPQDNVARFRDAFVYEEDGKLRLSVFTRLGGGNREGYASDIAKLRSLPGYLSDEDNGDDETYASFYYEVPERFQDDVRKLSDGRPGECSEEYRCTIIGTFPKIADQLRKVLYP